jgi:23S rRNA (cytosine1962-C5)-methyltransferase
MPSRSRQGTDKKQNKQVGQSPQTQPLPHTTILAPPRWSDYELIDSGNGHKLERFGSYRLVRPETQAIWSPALPADLWQQADAVFERGRGEDGPGEWRQHRPLPEQWKLQHESLDFWARLTPFRHTGIFPEHSAHWGWMRQQFARVQQPRVLVLFGYTGLHTLVAAQAGASVCHVDASKPAMRWAQANQEASRLEDRPVRWIVDDVTKFVRREIRRESRYDMVIMDPPVFGRGPKGEIWRLTEALPELIVLCSQLLSQQALGMLVHAYATNISPITLHNVLYEAMQGYAGEVLAGELVLMDTSAARPLPTALFARWTSAV